MNEYGSEERRLLRIKWRNHYGHDGTTHPTIARGCMFGSPLRDDVCHPATDATLSAEIRDEADVAARPGQRNRLLRLADRVDDALTAAVAADPADTTR